MATSDPKEVSQRRFLVQHTVCGYTWFSRVAQPKDCPKCGRWLQHHPETFVLGKFVPLETV
jgi:predicted Zn-ribbon and HTH transcriptional regulator